MRKYDPKSLYSVSCLMFLYFLLFIFIGNTQAQQNNQTIRVNRPAQLCSRYAGTLIGTRNGLDLQLNCDLVERLFQQVSVNLPVSPMLSARQTYMSGRNQPFAELLRNGSPTLQCTQRTRLESHLWDCSSFGLQNMATLVTTGRDGLVLELRATFPVAMFFQMLERETTRDQSMTPNMNFARLYMSLYYIRMLQLMAVNEDYELYENRIVYILRPWNVP